MKYKTLHCKMLFLTMRAIDGKNTRHQVWKGSELYKTNLVQKNHEKLLSSLDKYISKIK